MSDSLNCLGSFWCQSKPSDVPPIPQTSFLIGTFIAVSYSKTTLVQRPLYYFKVKLKPAISRFYHILGKSRNLEDNVKSGFFWEIKIPNKFFFEYKGNFRQFLPKDCNTIRKLDWGVDYNKCFANLSWLFDSSYISLQFQMMMMLFLRVLPGVQDQS